MPVAHISGFSFVEVAFAFRPSVCMRRSIPCPFRAILNELVVPAAVTAEHAGNSLMAVFHQLDPLAVFVLGLVN